MPVMFLDFDGVLHLECLRKRGHTDQVIPSVMDAVACVDCEFQRRHGRPELLIHACAQNSQALTLQKFNRPAVKRRVPVFVFFDRSLAKGSLPDRGVGLVVVEQHSIRIQSNDRSGVHFCDPPERQMHWLKLSREPRCQVV